MPSNKAANAAVPVQLKAQINQPIKAAKAQSPEKKQAEQVSSPAKQQKHSQQQQNHAASAEADRMKAINAAQMIEILYLKQQIQSQKTAITQLNERIQELEKKIQKSGNTPVWFMCNVRSVTKPIPNPKKLPRINRLMLLQ